MVCENAYIIRNNKSGEPISDKGNTIPNLLKGEITKMEFDVIVRIDNENGVISQQANMPNMEYDRLAERMAQTNNEVYGAKWTPNGLIYTHKMNERGEFEEIEKSQEQIKAEAFDVLKKYIPINLIRQNMFVFECREYLTAEEIEILKKAGLE